MEQMWIVLTLLGPVLLGIALFYGMRRSHSRRQMEKTARNPAENSGKDRAAPS